ncbi:G-BOX-BINDING FACTOR 3-RELATED [Salix viminalis]|uniref:G-BOX-BINDING FACTOR 3-RELATED n=1 Tax=Salix viminalis TaxID=40686 RepID=A0A9Q0SIZ4_SALVM|nr:G-BOX-BINDING FACTOR 3-RELATED [Salix viminalis]
MGTGEESTPAKPSKPASSNQEIPTTPSYPDWSSSMQAYYGAGATPPPFFASTVASPTPHPYIWGSQHPLIPPYGTPVPYPALYPAGGVYAHPNMTPIPNSTQGRVERQLLALELMVPPKVLTVVVMAHQMPVTRILISREYGASKKGSFNQMLADANAQSTSSGANIQASVPGKPVVSMPATNLNIGMDLWNASSAAGATKMRPNPSGATSGVAPAGMPEQWIHDERELKRQKRKQSNRESARRSRLRKQAECEELQVRVESLSNDNSNLRDELQSLSGECNKLKSENDSIKEELTRLYGPEAVDKLEQCNPASVLQGAVDSKTETS